MSDDTSAPRSPGHPRVILMQYMGVLSLLGRVSGKLSSDDKACVAQAMSDANRVLDHVRYRRTSNGGWGAFERDVIERQETEERARKVLEQRFGPQRGE